MENEARYPLYACERCNKLTTLPLTSCEVRSYNSSFGEYRSRQMRLCDDCIQGAIRTARAVSVREVPVVEK